MKRAGFILVIALAAGVAWVGWLLRAESGHARLERWIQARLPEILRIEGLSGHLPFSGQLALLELRDTNGVWAKVEMLSWTLQGRPLLQRRITARFVTARAVTVARWPDGDSDSNAETRSNRPEIWIQHLQADALHLPMDVLGDPVTLSARGSFHWRGASWAAEGVATGLWRGAAVEGEVSARSSETNLSFAIHRATADGLVVRGAGEWRPSREIHLAVAFTNPPIFEKALDAGSLGRGACTADFRWDEERSVNFSFALDDATPYGIALARAEGSGTVVGSNMDVRIASARGAWRGEEWRVLRPFTLHGSGGGVRWENAEWEALGCSVESAGRFSPAEVDASFRLLPVELAHSRLSDYFLAGTARASVSVVGSRSDPVWRFALIGSNVQPRLHNAFQLNPAQFSANAIASSGVLRVGASLVGLTREPVTAALSLPVRLPLDGSDFGMDPEDPIEGQLAFALDLEEAGSYADLRGAELVGNLKGDIEVGGKGSEPLVRGKIILRDARAEYPESGTVLENIRLVLQGNQDRLIIREAAADDGEGGRISLEGSILFKPAEGFPLQAQLHLSRATLFRREGNRVRFDGRVGVAGRPSALSVTGRVDLVDAELQLRPSLPRIPQLPIAALEEESVVEADRTSWLDTLTLDVALRGRDMHVYGRGLDSIWRADLRVNGNASAPRIQGPISVERGYFLFLGRRFLLDRAVLSLDGRWPPSPSLDLTASSRAGDMQAWLYAAGLVDDLVLRLESDPAYPPDEILSRLLFGRSTDRISVFQAVSLAHGLSLLRGRGRTVEVLERGQSLLRVDQLELVQSEGSEGISAISVGKYVGRNVYVEGEKSLGSAADVITVEVELTPSLILSTESSPRIREGIGLKWRHDY
ncbi:MAG: translocation/assembly module TamB domain-containing protein [Verrucomicrobia bacterium]|nr:translocation/assembly module TamB domain-containing protein [Kiritimatiellia bacterium]MCO6399793.1 translocation/assembly module TamB domain-containing protein [Verrucomicrobiota bacterium]